LANLGLLASGFLLTASGALNLERVSQQNEQEKHFTRSASTSLAVLYVFSITFIKLSIIFMYKRTFTMLKTWFRYAWYFTFTLILLWTATCITLLGLQASGKLPKSGFFRLAMSITGVVNGFTDVLILGLPAVMVSRMKLARKQKVALISIFLIGGMYVSPGAPHHSHI
jgi:cytochrome bd-type quinol oxidase subunit 2